eukprot:1679885-Rhodomonas_salina.4
MCADPDDEGGGKTCVEGVDGVGDDVGVDLVFDSWLLVHSLPSRDEAEDGHAASVDRLQIRKWWQRMAGKRQTQPQVARVPLAAVGPDVRPFSASVGAGGGVVEVEEVGGVVG